MMYSEVKISDKYNFKLYHISDLHGRHESLNVPLGVDVMVVTGDATNHRDVSLNYNELIQFAEWYENIPVPIKIYVPGNHDAALYGMVKDSQRLLRDSGIDYLHKESLTLFNDFVIYGDGTTPSYGDWYFMSERHKIVRHWEQIPKNTNVLLTHTPPKGCLDITVDRDRILHRAGCGALSKTIQKIPSIQLHCFGHIHDVGDIKNTGILYQNDTHFSNAAAVKDREFDKGVLFHGNIFEF